MEEGESSGREKVTKLVAKQRHEATTEICVTSDDIIISDSHETACKLVTCSHRCGATDTAMLDWQVAMPMGSGGHRLILTPLKQARVSHLIKENSGTGHSYM